MEQAIERLRAAISGRHKDEVVTFDGQELLVGYGVYLLRYLEGEQQITREIQEQDGEA